MLRIVQGNPSKVQEQQKTDAQQEQRKETTARKKSIVYSDGGLHGTQQFSPLLDSPRLDEQRAEIKVRHSGERAKVQ